jgi:hypothetical protein
MKRDIGSAHTRLQSVARGLLSWIAIVAVALSGFSAHIVRADEVDSIPLEVLPVQPDTNNQPDAPQARLLRDDVSNVEVTSRLPLAEQGVISTKHASTRIVPRGQAAAQDTVAASQGDIIRFAAARADALQDGVYAEELRFQVIAAAFDAPLSQVAYRYFEVKNGKLTALNESEYSARVERLETISDGQSFRIGSAVTREGAPTTERGRAVRDDAPPAPTTPERTEVNER